MSFAVSLQIQRPVLTVIYELDIAGALCVVLIYCILIILIHVYNCIF